MFDGIGVSSGFVRALRGIDQYLRACFDPSQDAIIIWAERTGKPKTHEFTSRRSFIEVNPDVLDPDGQLAKKRVSLNMPDLEAFTIKRLREVDVWKTHGTGKAFDDWLADQESTYRDKERKRFKHERMEYLKDYRKEFAGALENLKRGIVVPNQKRPLTRKEVAAILGPKQGQEKRILIGVGRAA